MSAIALALHDLLNEQEIPLEEAIERHFTDDYRQRTNGEVSDRAGFAAHIAHLRAIVEYAEIQVIDEFENGPRYADRHIVRLTKRDGNVVGQEVYVFATRAADGRFASLDEVTLLLDGDDADRAIATARG